MNVINNNNHFRKLLSGISALDTQSGADPRVLRTAISGMTPLLKGFTLIEVLVVVLIIGVLTAVALPQYQKAVLKSRYSAMMPIAKAIAEGNETFYMEHGNYSKEPTELMVQGRAEYPDGTSVLMYDEDRLSYVRATNNSVPNARYLVYQKHSANFADTTMCEAKDDVAKELCQSLGGVFVSENGTESNWTAYLLSGQLAAGDGFARPCLVDNGVCNYDGELTGCNSGYYSYGGSCRVSHAGDYDYAEDDICGDGTNNIYCKIHFGDNSTCTNWARCDRSVFHDESSCTKAGYCNAATFKDNATCSGNGRCHYATFENNSTCDGGYCDTSEGKRATFKDNSSCINGASCQGAVFTGNSICMSTLSWDTGRGGCSSTGMQNGVPQTSTFRENAVCAGGGCSSAIYEEGSNACCAGSDCPSGHVRKCVWNGQTYERVGYWDDPAS